MESTKTAEFPQGEGQQQQQQQQQLEPAFDSACESDTPQMWMDDVERLRASGADVAGLYPLHHVAFHGRADIAKLILDRGYDDKNALDDTGSTALQHAAIQGHVNVTMALLAAGADLNLRCKGNMSPLGLAVSMGHVDTARVLIEHGADVTAAPAGDGSTLLHAAAVNDRSEIVSLLCLKGADVDKVDDHGRTSLQVAALRGHAATARALLVAGADAHVRYGGHGESSAIGVAAMGGHANMLMAMIEHGADVNAADSDGLTALHVAAMYNRKAAIEVLVGAGADIEARVHGTRKTPLSFAARKNNLSAVVVLLRHGACVCNRDATDRTALHYLVAYAGRLRTAEVVDLMLRYGADEEAVDIDRQAPADVVGSKVSEQYSLAEDVERVRQLLANAPADRAWRRRGVLVLCRAFYPSGRVQLGHKYSHDRDTSSGEPSRAQAEWVGVASMLMGAGADPISLMGDGAYIIFETIVGFL